MCNKPFSQCAPLQPGPRSTSVNQASARASHPLRLALPPPPPLLRPPGSVLLLRTVTSRIVADNSTGKTGFRHRLGGTDSRRQKFWSLIRVAPSTHGAVVLDLCSPQPSAASTAARAASG